MVFSTVVSTVDNSCHKWQFGVVTKTQQKEPQNSRAVLMFSHFARSYPVLYQKQVSWTLINISRKFGFPLFVKSTPAISMQHICTCIIRRDRMLYSKHTHTTLSSIFCSGAKGYSMALCCFKTKPLLARTCSTSKWNSFAAVFLFYSQRNFKLQVLLQSGTNENFDFL